MMEQKDEFDDDIVGVMPPRFQEKEESPEIGVIRELSPKKVKEQVMMELKGFYYDFEQKKYVATGEKPMMNNLGIQKFINALSAITDTVTFSNYTIEQVNPFVLFIMESVIPTIYINYKEYGITNKSDLPVLTSKLFVLTSAAFQKAVGAGDRGVIGRTISENIVSRAGQFPQNINTERRTGLFSNLNPFRK
jgi:hypothetical protein